jgi:hypothetical protein
MEVECVYYEIKTEVLKIMYLQVNQDSEKCFYFIHIIEREMLHACPLKPFLEKTSKSPSIFNNLAYTKRLVLLYSLSSVLRYS